MNVVAVVTVISLAFSAVENHDHGAHEAHHTTNADTQKPIWNYYGKAKIDLEHVLLETKNIWKLQKENKISERDAAFYYHKLHDFNSDGYLDGLELLHATRHSIDTMPNGTNYGDFNDLEKLAETVDVQLQYFDYDGDGLVEFAELAKYIDDNTVKQNQ